MKACIACGGAAFRRALEIADYPAYLVPLPRPLAREVVRATLCLDACERCGHLQKLDPDEALQRLIYER